MIKNSLKNREGYSLIFAFIFMLTISLTAVGVFGVTQRNLARTDWKMASSRAQMWADGIFEDARAYINNNCEAGCDYSGESILEEGVMWGEYSIEGLSAENADDGLYYVPIPGRGDMGEDCDPDSYGEPDEDPCNWNRIGYGETVTIPLYVDGSTTVDFFAKFDIKVRTPECEEGDSDCDLATNRKLIACADGTVSESVNDCSTDDNLVVMTWQIRGNRDSGSDYIEGYRHTNVMSGERDGDDSEIYTTQINDQMNNSYVVLDIGDAYAPREEEKTIFDALTDGVDPMTTPVLKLSFIQTISNSDGAIPYLEYQIVTDEPISSDRSFISVMGYTVSKGDTYFWPKEGSYSQFSSSPINFVFQN